MNLSQFPRRRYTAGKTPIEKMAKLSQLLGGPELYIKRDDLLAGAAGGNKTRKLEFVMAEALAKGADTVITCGAVQSNHCRLTLSAAVREGLKCRLVLEERVPGSFKKDASGNNFLFRLMGVEKITVLPAGTDMLAAMNVEVDDLRKAGRTGYVIPGGASSPLGAMGYVSCAQEIMEQLWDQGLKIDRVVTASGSGGTHSGLLAGLSGTNAGIPVVGINVSRTKEAQEALIWDLVQKTAALAGVKSAIGRDEVLCFGDWVGPGYSLPTDEMVEAVTLFAQNEAILLDPVYTGKAAAGLVNLVRQGFFRKDEKVLFLHTGGSPALYAYMDTFYKTLK